MSHRFTDADDDNVSVAGTDVTTVTDAAAGAVPGPTSSAPAKPKRTRRLTQLKGGNQGEDPQSRTELLAGSAAPAMELLSPAPSEHASVERVAAASPETAASPDAASPEEAQRRPLESTEAAAVAPQAAQSSDDEQQEDPERVAAAAKWKSRRKHLFILSSAGRPIFTRWGNEFEFAELFSLLQTLVSIVETTGDALRRVGMGSHEMYFYAKEELTFVMVTATGESPQSCFDQLRVLHTQMLAVLPNVHQILKQHPGYDVRRMFAAGDIRVMQNLIRRLNNDPGFVFGVVPMLPLAPTVRDNIAAVLRANYQGDGDDDQSAGSDDTGSRSGGEGSTGSHLYSLIISGNRVATLVQSKDFPVATPDILLLINFALSVLTATQSEVWAPICLPDTNPTGYMWCYCRPLRPEVLLVHVANAQSKFVELSVASSHIAADLQDNGLLDQIEAAGLSPWPEMPGQLYRSGLMHYLYIKDKQLALSTLPSHVCTRAHRKAFLRKLRVLRDKALGVCSGQTPFLVSSDSSETITVEISHATGVETYATFLPSTPRGDIQGLLSALSKTLASMEATQLALRPMWWPSYD